MSEDHPSTFKFDNFSTSVSLNELEHSKGILKYEIEADNGLDADNTILGTSIIPVDLTKNFTQSQIDENKHLTRTTSIMNNNVQLPLEIILIP